MQHVPVAVALNKADLPFTLHHAEMDALALATLGKRLMFNRDRHITSFITSAYEQGHYSSLLHWLIKTISTQNVRAL